MDLPNAPACERNREPILEVLRRWFADRRDVLEIGSGTAQHAVHFAAAMPQLAWQCSDRPAYLPGICARLEHAALHNTPVPITLDVNDDWPSGPYDAVFSANTLHIMSWPEVERLFAMLPRVTTSDARLVIYGPFHDDGHASSESNAAFDASLKARASHMGIRDRQAVDALASAAGFSLQDDVAMPANNLCRVWQRNATAAGAHS